MKILVVMKRFGAGKDMVRSHFGRQIQLFEPLVKKHTVHFFCPDYTKKQDFEHKKNGIRFVVKPFGLTTWRSSLRYFDGLVKKGGYDVIVGTTDPLISVWAHRVAKKYGVAFVYDVQDNYEFYGSYKLLLVKSREKQILRTSHVLSVSHSLADHLRKKGAKHSTFLPNGVDLTLFKKRNKEQCRKKLSLPNGPIICYIGHLIKVKGSKQLLDAFALVKKKHPNAHLLLSGQIHHDTNIKKPGVIYRAFPKREEVAMALSACDVAVVPLPKNAFSKYCFPYKIFEYLAAGAKVVATDVGDIKRVLNQFGGEVCLPGSAQSLAQGIEKSLKTKPKIITRSKLQPYTWNVLSKKLEAVLKKAVRA